MEEFKSVLTQHNVVLSEEFIEPLLDYTRRLWEWNSRLNLTRHTDFETFVTRDLIDSIRLSGHIPDGSTVLDVGSGGGVPGIILAITRPDLVVSLAESVGKKARALASIAKELRLTLPVHAERAEKVLKTKSFDVMTVRAVASLRKLLFWFQKQPASFGQMLLIKGPRWEAEKEEAEEEGLLTSVRLSVIDEYRTPGHDNNSVILSIRYSSPEAAR